VVALVGATPVFADVDAATFNIAPDSAARAVEAGRQAGLNPRMIIPVDLFGLPADFAAIKALAAAENLFVLDDAAQGFGATVGNHKVGVLSDATATSFFPAKPLGCYGDGGAVFTDDDDMRDLLVSLRVHGQGAHRYDNVRIGLTARLDTIQAAVLIEKLKIFPDEIAERNRIARRYAQHLSGVVTVPRVPDHMTSVWAQYTIRVKAGTREAFAAALKTQGVPTAIYYPKPLHRQDAYRHFPADPDGLPVTDMLAGQVISLPMHAYLDDATQDRIIAAVRRAVG
jgi:dTDP-4-amino-4,6-dideoxygalactose transaminase